MNRYDPPLILQRADPCILLSEDGYYYFTATVPAFDLIELRRARSIEELGAARPKVVWRRHEDGPMSRYIWAPELHRIDGKWMIYFAAAQAEPDEHGVFDHRIYALANDAQNPMEGRFEECGQIQTGMESFSLDATSFSSGGQRYFVWAQRDYAIPGNSNLYIARMRSATELELPGVLLSRPEYDWECQGFLVNEGPTVLRHHGRLYLTYSGSATDERYAMGMLEAQEGTDLLDPASWKKSPRPVMTTDEAHQIYGPGHNSFTRDAQGRDLLVFHARPYPGFRGSPLGDPNRNTYVWPVSYDGNDRPVFA